MNEQEQEKTLKGVIKTIVQLRERILDLENTNKEMAELYEQQLDKYAFRVAELETLLEHSIGADCREMRLQQEIENKDAQIIKLKKWQNE